MPEGQMTLAALSHVSLGVEDPEAIADFYVRTVGLRESERVADGTIRLGWGHGFHALELRAGDGIDHFGLELPDAAAVDAMAARLRSRGIDAAREHSLGEHVPVLAFCDPDGNRVEAHGPVARGGEHAADPGRRPIRIDHITLASRDLHRQVAFYQDVLGFRVSDRMGDVFAWLRCGPHHHTVAIVDGAAPRLDHYAYEVGGWEDLKTWCDELAVRGVAVEWGPGRHGPGNNLFIMFADPAGNRIELSCEMERFWDDRAAHVARRWEPHRSTVNLWGPAPAWRAAVTA